MAGAVEGAVKALDSFVRSVSVPDTNAPPDEKPFDVLDYGKAADHVGAMVRDLSALLKAADQSLPQAERLGQQMGDDARRVINHAFRLGLLLIVAAGVVAVLVVWISRKLPATSRGDPPADDL